MNLRIDKVVRFASFGARRVYSLVLTDECLYLIRTGSFGALKHYRVDSASRQLIADRPDDRSVKEIQTNEARIDSMPLDQLIGGDNYVVRLGAIEHRHRATLAAHQMVKLEMHYLNSSDAAIEPAAAPSGTGSTRSSISWAATCSRRAGTGARKRRAACPRRSHNT